MVIKCDQKHSPMVCDGYVQYEEAVVYRLWGIQYKPASAKTAIGHM